ncbi:MAG TPA: LuxR family transcriptional regulator [Bacteroidetes bacterium]|nr:LuxR family transcriptional regulator [Bacteroidota bacterium]
MTKREREVTSLTIKGMTAAKIAAKLGIAETTVITHRNKAYRRLGVSNLRDLMRL